MITALTSTDDNYVPHLATMLLSLNTHIDKKIDVVIVDYGISEGNLNLLKDFLIKLDKLNFRIISFEKEIKNQISSDINLLFHPASVLVHLPLLNIKTEKVLLLDSDLIINDTFDVDSIFIDNFVLSAVPDRLLSFTDLYSHDFGKNDLYFNSGVLAVNQRLWVEQKITEKIMNILDSGKYLDNIFLEQDVFNVVFKDNWKPLPIKYNYLDGLGYQKIFRNKPIYRDLRLQNRPMVIHFAGPNKPWHYSSSSEYKKEYIKFRQRTPWSISEHKIFLMNFITLPLRFLSRMGIPMMIWKFMYKNKFYQTRVYGLMKSVRKNVFK